MRSPNVSPPGSFNRESRQPTLSQPLTASTLALPRQGSSRQGSFNSVGGGSFNSDRGADSIILDPPFGGSFDNNRDGQDQSEDGFGRAGETQASMFFPFEFCRCCPPMVKHMLPSTFQRIQDFTHLTLLLGVIGAGVMFFQALYELVNKKSCHTNCAEEFLILFSTVPCGWYILKMIGTYDEHIQEKERAIAKKKKELSANYDSLIKGMDDLLGKASESSATMAERSFESKRRDFQRFLERAETRYAQIAGTKIDNDMMLQQFRRFVQRWLVVFEECSVDPIGNPKKVVTEEELNRCRTIGDVASLTLERLKATEVRFISCQKDKDEKMLKGFRAQVRRITVPVQKQLQDAPTEIELSSDLRHRLPKGAGNSFEIPDSGSDLENGRQRGGSWEQQPQQKKKGCPCNWLKVGPSGCGYQSPNNDYGWPKTCLCVCCQISFLSRAHFFLMIGLLCSIAIVLLEVLDPNHLLIPVVAGTVAFAVCLVVLLIRFEQIDVIQKLEREVNELAAESERIVERKEQMVKFWNSMQQLTDLWVHRTVPRLDLLKEVQGHLEDAPPEDVLALMAGANTRLEDLENHLPDLSLWRHTDTNTAPELTEDSKKAFAERVERLCHEEKLPKILQGISKVIEAQILCIDDGGDRPQKISLSTFQANRASQHQKSPSPSFLEGGSFGDRGGSESLSFSESKFGSFQRVEKGSFR